MAVKLGSRYGDLEPVEKITGTKNGSLWRCKCHRCGSEYIARGRDLQAGVRRDCGCKLRDKSIAPGKKFGNVIILRKSETQSKPQRWIIKCLVCGVEKEMRQSSICRNPKSCGCLSGSPEKMKKLSKIAIDSTVKDGTQLYVVSKSTPNAGNKSGYRWVRVIHRKNAPDWFYAVFWIRGERYYRGGFASAESASFWAQDEHRRLLEMLGIKNPRER